MKVVLVGASTGALQTVPRFLEALPRPLTFCCIVVIHRTPEPSRLAEILARGANRPVTEVCDATKLQAGVFLAPPSYHLLVDESCFVLSADEPVNFSRPSIDVAAESVADTFGASAMGVFFGGANSDGALGARYLFERGATILVEEPEHAQAPTLPRAVLEEVPDAVAASAEDLAAEISRLAEQSQHYTGNEQR